MDNNYGRKMVTGQFQGLVLLHAVDRTTGILSDCKLLFKSVGTDGRYYYTEINVSI